MNRMLNAVGGLCLLSWLYLLPVILAGLVVRSTDAMGGACLAIAFTAFIWDTKFRLKTWKLWENKTEVGIGDEGESPQATPAFTAGNPWGENRK